MDSFRTTHWHIVISGFTQTSDRPHGMFKLWRKLCEFRSYNTAVELHPWNARWGELAENIFLCSEDTTPRINIYSYSWGTGWGAMQLCRELHKRGINVLNLVSSDGVYRHPYYIGSWRALVPWSSIWVPDNVRHVAWFRQKENIPSGHNLLAVNPSKTYIEPPTQIRYYHQYCDDSQAFHDECLKWAKNLHKVKE